MWRLFLLCIFTPCMFIAGHTSQAQEWSRLSPTPHSGWAQSLCAHQGTTLIMGQPGGPYWSADNGTTWIEADSDNLPGYGAISIASDGSNLFAARGSGGVSRSTDNGVTWIEANVGLPGFANAYAVAGIGGKVFAGLYGGGVYASTNGGSSWMRSDSGITNPTISVLGGTGDTVFAGTTDGKVFRSTNGGAYWTNVSPNSYSINTNVNAIIIADSSVLLGDRGPGFSPGILRSDDWGMTWFQFSTGINENPWGHIAGFAQVDTFLFAGLFMGFNHGGIYRGSLNTDWTNVSGTQMIATGPPDTYYIPVWSLATMGTTVFAGMSAFGLYRSTDLGTTWEQITSDVSTGSEERLAFAFREDTLYAGGSSSGVFISTDSGEFWEEYVTNLFIHITSYAFVDTVMFAGHSFSAGISRSMDGGRVWESISSSLPGNTRSINKLASSGTTLLAATEGGVVVSSDFGNSWLNTSWGAVNAISLHASGSVVLASDPYEVYRSTDVGQTWIRITNGLPASWAARDYARVGNTLFVGGGPAPYLHMSTDEGLSWSGISGPITSPVWALTSAGDTLYAAMESLIYYTTDLGQNWELVPGNGLSGIVRYRALMVNGGYIYAGMGGGGYGAFRRPVPGGPTSVEQIGDGIPDRTMLLQNYPNPFNPATMFRYELSQPEQVGLRIYNMLGQLVRTLVDEHQAEGYREILWDGRNESGATVTSGIYLYRMTAGSYMETRKMMVIK